MFSGLQSRVAVGFGGLSLGLRLCLEVSEGCSDK